MMSFFWLNGFVLFVMGLFIVVMRGVSMLDYNCCFSFVDWVNVIID